jgi:flagellar assembly protein FliH
MNDLPNKNGEKFLFNVHCFDEDFVKEVEEEIPPPPMFTQEELEAAKHAAFTKGHTQALEEAKASRGQHLATVLETLSNDLARLCTQEERREKLYEQEAVGLSLAIFSKLFPLYQQQYGFDELAETIKTVLSRHEGQKDINVFIHPDLVQGVEAFLAKIQRQDSGLFLRVTGDESLGLGAAKVTWTDGGAVRDTESMAGQIEALIKQALAARGVKVHDRQEDTRENGLRNESAAAPVSGTEQTRQDKPPQGGQTGDGES